MNNNDVNIKIGIDSDIKELLLTRKEAKNLDGTFKKTKKSTSELEQKIQSLAKRFGPLALAIGGVTTAWLAFKKTYDSGIGFNREIQKLTNSFQTLVMVTSENKTTAGETVSLIQKQNIAYRESQKILANLQEINAKTPHTLTQTAEIYRGMYPSMKKIGMTNEQIATMTEKISIFAGDAGIEFNQILSGVDGLANGTVMANSEFGRLLGAIGLTNDELKQSDDIFRDINEKLSDVRGLDSFDRTLSNATNSFNIFAGELTEPIFGVLQDGLKETIEFFDKLTERIKTFKVEQDSIYETSTIKDATIKANQFADELVEVQRKLRENDGWAFFGLDDRSKQELLQREKYLNFQLEQLGKWVVKTAEIKEGEVQLKPKIDETTGSIADQKKAIKELVDSTPELEDMFTRLGKKYDDYALKNEAFEERAKIAFENINEWSVAGYETILNIREELMSEAQTNDQIKSVEVLFEQKIQAMNDFMVLTTTSANETIVDSIKSIDTAWDKTVSSMYQSIEDNFFDLIMRDFDDLGDFFEDIFEDIGLNLKSSIARGFSGDLTAMLMGGLGGQNSGMNEILSQAGLSLVNGQWVGGGETGGEPNIVVSAAGEVVKGGDLLGGDVLNNLSSLKSAYDFFSSGIGGMKAATSGYFLDAGTYMSNVGFNTVGQGVANFGAGFSNTLYGGSGIYNAGLATGAGSLAGAGALGYGIGSLGDMAFGTNTQAANYGAIGAAIGSVIPVIGTVLGAVIGSIIGGLNASWEPKASGLRLNEDISAASVKDIETYELWKKKSWAGTSSREYYDEADDSTILGIVSAMNLLQDAADMFGGGEVSISAGTYLGENHTVKRFSDAMGKAFVSAMTGIEPTIEKEVKEWSFQSFTQIAEGVRDGLTEAVIKTVENPELTEAYKVWEEHAKSLDLSPFEAIQEYIEKLISTQRSFTEWTLQKDPVALAAERAKNAEADAERIANSLGVDFAQITAENFLSQYNNAVKNSFDPVIIDQWNALGYAFMEASNAQATYANTVLESSAAMYNGAIAMSAAFGESTLQLQRDMLYSQAIGFVESNTWGNGSYQNLTTSDVDSWISQLQGMSQSERLEWMGSSQTQALGSILTQLIQLNSVGQYSTQTIQPGTVSVGTYNPTETNPVTTEETNDVLRELINALEDASRSFEDIISTTQSFIDSMYANNAGYQGGLYQTYLGESENLAARIYSGDYTQADIDALQIAAAKASEYGQNYFNTKSFENYYDEQFERTVAANRFAKIQDQIQETGLNDIVKKLEEMRKQEEDTQTEMLRLTEKIAEANERIDIYLANGGSF